jgi:hypothetical protein
VAGSKPATQKVTADFLRDITVSALLDGHYDYNFNSPVGRVNSLRAYDVNGHSLDDLRSSQPTLGVGLVWWLGQKEGAW